MKFFHITGMWNILFQYISCFVLFFSDKIFAVPFVKKCWDVGKFCVGKVGTFVSDFRNVEGNVSILIERKYFILGHIKLIPVFKFSS